MRGWLVVVALGLAIPAQAQDGGAGGDAAAAAVAEFDALALKKVTPRDMKARNEAVAAWAERPGSWKFSTVLCILTSLLSNEAN